MEDHGLIEVVPGTGMDWKLGLLLSTLLVIGIAVAYHSVTNPPERFTWIMDQALYTPPDASYRLADDTLVLQYTFPPAMQCIVVDPNARSQWFCTSMAVPVPGQPPRKVSKAKGAHDGTS